MFYVIINKLGVSVDTIKYKIKSLARRRILLYKMRPDDLALSNYLIKRYNLNLKQLCLILLNKATISATEIKDELTVSFMRHADKQLATLITFGNSEICGSKILKFAFDWSV